MKIPGLTKTPPGLAELDWRNDQRLVKAQARLAELETLAPNLMAKAEEAERADRQATQALDIAVQLRDSGRETGQDVRELEAAQKQAHRDAVVARYDSDEAATILAAAQETVARELIESQERSIKALHDETVAAAEEFWTAVVKAAPANHRLHDLWEWSESIFPEQGNQFRPVYFEGLLGMPRLWNIDLLLADRMSVNGALETDLSRRVLALRERGITKPFTAMKALGAATTPGVAEGDAKDEPKFVVSAA